MSSNNDWVRFEDAKRLMIPKFAEERIAISMFFHAVKVGFIRSRAAEIRRTGIQRPGDANLTKLVDRHGNVVTKAWASLSPSHEESDLSRDIFCLLNSWGNPIATFHNVEFSRIDIAKLVSRSGVGGAPFKKIHWQKMTSTLLELAFAKDGHGFDRFDSYSDFLSYLEGEINGSGDALDRSSINSEARRYWDQYRPVRIDSTNP